MPKVIIRNAQLFALFIAFLHLVVDLLVGGEAGAKYYIGTQVWGAAALVVGVIRKDHP